MATGARRRPTWAWRFLVALVGGALRRLRGWRVHAQGPARVPPPDRPLVAVFNHTSTIDGFLVADVVWRGLRHWVRPLVKAELFDVPVLGTLARAAGAIPVLRADDEGREAAYGRAVEELRGGGTILFAPEGTVTHDGTLLPLRHGAARLALEAGAEVLVVTHFGAQRGFSPVVRFPQRGAVVTMSLDLLQPRADEDAGALTGRIAAVLLDRSAELRDTYPQADPAARWWPPYAAPAAPTATARQNLEHYQESMVASVAAARERMARYAEEARDRAELATEQARNAVEERTGQLRELGEHARERVEELGEQVRERAQELGEQARDRADDVGLARRSGDPDPRPTEGPDPGGTDEPTDEGRSSGQPPAGPLSA